MEEAHGVRPYALPVRLVDPVTDKVEEEILHVLAPYELFGAVFHLGGIHEFAKSFFGEAGEASVAHYWQQAKHTDWGRRHPASADPACSKIVPIAWHADGAETYNNAEFHICSWSSSLAFNGDVVDQKMFMCIVDEQRLGPEAYDDIIAFKIWNNAVMMSGRHPEVNHLGQPFQADDKRKLLAGQHFAGGWKASFTAWYGDLKERVKAHRFKRNYLCNFLCERCLGNRHLSECSAFDFRPGADWRCHLQTHENYLATTAESDLSPFAALPRLRVDRCKWDLLHVCFLGFGKDVIGSTLLILSRRAANSRVLEALDRALRGLWVEFKAWCKVRRLSTTVPVFSLTIISVEANADYPTLAKRIKGAASRLILKLLAVKVHHQLRIYMCCLRVSVCSRLSWCGPIVRQAVNVQQHTSCTEVCIRRNQSNSGAICL